MYLRGANGIVVGYDITSKESLRTARNRYINLKTKYPSAVIMVIGNKVDLGHERRRVSRDEGEELANDLHASVFFESKTNSFTFYLIFVFFNFQPLRKQEKMSMNRWRHSLTR